MYIYIYFVLLTWTKSRNVGGSWRHSCDVNVMPCYSNQETWICISGIILGICSANCYAHTQNDPWYLHVIIPRQRNIACYWDVFYSGDVIMGAIASQITSLTIVYSTVYADQRKHQSSASLAFVRGIHRGPVNSPRKWPVTRKMFPFDDVIIYK